MVYPKARSNVSLRDTSMLRWAIMLSLLMVGARVIALSGNPSEMVLLAWSVLVGVISFISPMSGVAISIGNVFISLDDILPVGFSVGQIAGAGAATRMFLQIAIHQIKLERVWRTSHFAIAGIAFTILLSASVNDSPLPVAPLRKLSLIVLLYLITLIYIDTFDKLLFLQYTIVIISGFAAAWTIQQGMSTSFSDTFHGRGPGGLAGNPNYQAIYLAITIPLVISLVMYLKSDNWRLLAVCAGILIPVGVVTTASRGGLLVLSISFLISAMVWGPRRRGAQALVGVLLVVTFIEFSYSEGTQTRVNEALTNVSQGTLQNESRVRLSQESLNIWSSHPILGVGAGNWLSAGEQLENGATSAASAHVWPMQILAELGLIGFIWYVAFALFCIASYQAAIRVLGQRLSSYSDLVRGFFLAAVTMSLAWTSGNPYNQLWFELLLIGGISLSIISNQQEQSAMSPPKPDCRS